MIKFQILVILSFFNALAPYVILFTYNNPGDWLGLGIILYGIIYPFCLGVILTIISLTLKKEECSNIKSKTFKACFASTVSIILVIPIFGFIESFASGFR